jgi:hypothetical protein
MNDAHPDLFRAYARRCGLIFAVVCCGTLVMVGASSLPLPSSQLKIGIILATAAFNASVVAGYLMHLISERKLIYAMLAFTGVFFIGLMGLTIWATHDVPAVLKP